MTKSDTPLAQLHTTEGPFRIPHDQIHSADNSSLCTHRSLVSSRGIAVARWVWGDLDYMLCAVRVIAFFQI